MVIPYISQDLHFEVITNILDHLTKHFTKEEQMKLYEKFLISTINDNYNERFKPIEMDIKVVNHVFNIEM